MTWRFPDDEKLAARNAREARELELPISFAD